MESHVQPTTAGDRNMARAAGFKMLYEAIEALPEGITGEILHGQLHTQPRPAMRHAVAASNLGATLIGPYSRGRGGPGGWWIVDEPELHFVRDTEILVPDLAGWRRERMPEIPSDQRCEVVPDWICEVLSPATRSKDREIKMPLYARYGVAHAWIIDPGLETLEAYELRGAEWAPPAVYGTEDTVASAPFEAAAFRVADLWS
jgi:Uma2 family endonuclease